MTIRGVFLFQALSDTLRCDELCLSLWLEAVRRTVLFCCCIFSSSVVFFCSCAHTLLYVHT